MEVAVFIQNIQEERAEVALYISSNQSNDDATRKKRLTERFQVTDRALEEVPTWPPFPPIPLQLYGELGTGGTGSTNAFTSKLRFQIQHEVFR